MSQSMQEWRKANPEKRRAQARRAYQRHKVFVAEQLAGKCCGECGKTFDLVFHHVTPATKCLEIAGGGTPSKAAVLAEIAKCIVLCRSCHTALHNRIVGCRHVAVRDSATGRFVSHVPPNG